MLFLYKHDLAYCGTAAISQWIRLHLPSCCIGFESPTHTLDAFIIYGQNLCDIFPCIGKRTKRGRYCLTFLKKTLFSPELFVSRQVRVLAAGAWRPHRGVPLGGVEAPANVGPCTAGRQEDQGSIENNNWVSVTRLSNYWKFFKNTPKK